MSHPKIIVVGGGLAGLAATIKIAEMGGHVDLFSIVPVKSDINPGAILRSVIYEQALNPDSPPNTENHKLQGQYIW